MRRVEEREGLLPGNQVSLKAFPGCLHINEHPLFSTGAGAPTTAFPPNPLPLLPGVSMQASPGFLSLGLGLALHCPPEPQGPLERAVQPLLPALDNQTQGASTPGQASLQGHCQLNAKCLPLRVGWRGTDRKQHQDRSDLAMSPRSHIATGSVRKAPWKKAVDRGPWTHTHRQRVEAHP